VLFVVHSHVCDFNLGIDTRAQARLEEEASRIGYELQLDAIECMNQARLRNNMSDNSIPIVPTDSSVQFS
jgi:hypothetical protein